MIIQENQLRPPSPREMEERRMWLERFQFTDESPASYGYSWSVTAVSTLELIEFHKQWIIPYEARLLPGYDQDLILDWTHLVQCKVCQQWYEKDTDHANDALHTAVEAGTARAPEEIPDNPFPKGDPRGWVEYSKCKSHICAAQRKHVEECVR